MKEVTAIAIMMVLVFGLGWFCSNLVTNPRLETPFSLVSGANQELASPHDWIPEKNIHVYNDRIILDVQDAEWASFTNTNSMDPILDETSNALELVPKSEDDIHIGDIISYKSNYVNGVIIHRVVDIGEDEDGTFFIMKGDNNPGVDPERVRFDQVRRVVIGIIY